MAEKAEKAEEAEKAKEAKDAERVEEAEKAEEAVGHTRIRNKEFSSKKVSCVNYLSHKSHTSHVLTFSRSHASHSLTALSISLLPGGPGMRSTLYPALSILRLASPWAQ